jgi:hypothetical protein
MTARTHVYLSGPMTGLPMLNAPAFASAAHKLRALGFDVINPAENIQAFASASWEECMRVDIEQLVRDCYAVVYLPDWDESRGALLEMYIANALGMPRVSINDEIGLRRLLRQGADMPSGVEHSIVAGGGATCSCWPYPSGHTDRHGHACELYSEVPG